MEMKDSKLFKKLKLFFSDLEFISPGRSNCAWFCLLFIEKYIKLMLSFCKTPRFIFATGLDSQKRFPAGNGFIK